MPQKLPGFFIGKNSDLQSRFQIGLAVIVFAFCLIGVVSVYSLQRNMLEREALRQTDLVMSTIQATRGYIREVLRPRMYAALPDGTFILEAMSSSYITRVIMQTLQEQVPEFDYRRVALNARNPQFSPGELEQEMIDYFQNNPEQKTWSGVVSRQGVKHFIRFEPVRFSRSCLNCHGKPEDAPTDIVSRYGNTGGFFHTAGEISGVVSLSIPIESDLAGIRNALFKFFIGILAGGLLLFLFIRQFFSSLVVVKLRSLLEFFRETVPDAKGTRLYEQVNSRDEMGELSQGIRLLAEHILDSKIELEEHAAHLEYKVAQRTEALQLSRNRIRNQMVRRNRELRLLTGIAELTAGISPLREILSEVLMKTLQVIDAEGGAIYLLQETTFVLCCWQNIAHPPAVLDVNKNAKCARGVCLQGGDCLRFLEVPDESVLIPLCCRNKIHGFFLLSGLQKDRLDEQMQDLFISLGNQTGIAVNSIQSTSALRHSEELLRTMFLGISDPLVLLDTSGRLKMANEAFLRKNNLVEAQVTDLSLEELRRQTDCLIGRATVDVDLTRPQPRQETIMDGEGCYFDVLFYPVLDSDEQVSAVICLARDITELKLVEQKMRRTEKLAATGQLAAGVAHEINNPLWVIQCHTDIIKNSFPQLPELLTDIEVIERHARHCQKIISDLLHFTRTSERGTVRTPVNISEEITRITAMVSPQFTKQRISITVQSSPEKVICTVDADKMQQVILNLLINAAQSIEYDGRIHFSLNGDGDMAVISVTDDGPGIDPAITGRIFDPFFTTKEQGEGTGLGLSVSYAIVRDHGGDIQVSSKPGKTVFTFTLPLSRN